MVPRDKEHHGAHLSVIFLVYHPNYPPQDVVVSSVFLSPRSSEDQLEPAELSIGQTTTYNIL
jgi:hypothetical protein